MRASLPTLNALIHQGARVVVCSHLGRPDGAPDPKYSLAPVAQRLSELLGQARRVRAATRWASAARDAVGARRRRRRGHREPALQRRARRRRTTTSARRSPAELADFGDALVSDGFGVVHRKQASVYELAETPAERGRPPDRRRARGARPAHRDPRAARTRSFSADRRSRDKLGVIGHLLPRVDTLLIGGGMLFTFLAAQGHKVGVEPSRRGPARHRARLPREAAGARRRDRAPDRRRRRVRLRAPTRSTW